MSNILEMANRAKSGRKTISFIAHEIYTDATPTNKNGIHWKLEYVKNNMGSLKGMPICCEFSDEDKMIPLGHGYTGNVLDENGFTPTFNNSVVVGNVEYGEIKKVVVDEKEILALVCCGIIYTHRFPNFHKWLKENYSLGIVDTSIEITGIDGSDIVYENNDCSDEYRIPEKYEYSGTAILSIPPADNSAIVLEVAQLLDNNKEENKNMDENKIIDAIRDAIVETNSAKEDLNANIAELNSVIESKDKEISELKEAKEASEKSLSDKDEDIKKLQETNEKMKSDLDDSKVKELNTAFDSELAKFTEEQKASVISEINAYKKHPLEGDADAIISKICVGIVTAQREAEEKRRTELNTKRDDETLSIFSEINEEVDEDSELPLWEN